MSVNPSPVIYPQPVEEEPSPLYRLTLNGTETFVHSARVSAVPFNQVWPGYQRPLDQTELAGFASWDMSAPVECAVTTNLPVRSVRVRPAAAGIKASTAGGVISFTISRPGQYTVEINGTHQALHLFANPPAEPAPAEDAPGVLYFGPGVHCAGKIQLQDNQTVYLDGGAVVYGHIEGKNVSGVRILGRGILDGSKFSRRDVSGCISLRGCRDVRIDGIVLRDPCAWTITPMYCQDVHIRNVKLIGLWRYNADGIDFCNCQRCSLTDSFLRTFDDGVVFKGFSDRSGQYPEPLPVQDITVERCVFWCDWGRAIEFGAETVTPEIANVTCRDCDVIHTTHIALDIQNGDRAHVHDIDFENIRVELDDDFTRPALQQGPDDSYNPPAGLYTAPLLVLEVRKNYYSKDSERGRIENIRLQDIAVTSWQVPASYLRGYDAGHPVQGVAFRSLRINGVLITDAAAAGIDTNEFVKDVTLE
ncbi:MAG: glycosyl hydrolase family 28 protein [Anaerolineae bacterium]